MAAAAQPPPGLFTFFKHDALLPARNRGLFLPLLALTAALLVVTPRLVLLVDSLLEAAAALVGDNANVHAELAVVGGAIKNRVSAAVAVVDGAIQIIIVSAAVASYTGERHTLVSILGKVQSNLWGPLDTVAFGFVLQFAAQLPLKILVYSFSFIQQPALYALLELASLPVKAISDVAVVVSVAEPGLHGKHAAARAWRLMEGKKAHAALYAAAVWTLSLLCKLPAVDVAFELLGCPDEVFFMAVVTAYYFECRRSQRHN